MSGICKESAKIVNILRFDSQDLLISEMIYFGHSNKLEKNTLTGYQYFIKNALSKSVFLISAILIAGCQSTKQSESQIEDAGQVEQQQVTSLPDVELSQDLLTQILTAEVAVRAGQFEQAVDLLLVAAKKSSDQRLASKATYWSLQSGLHDRANQAAQLWIGLLDKGSSKELVQAQMALASSQLELGQADQALVVYRNIISDSNDEEVYKRIAGEMSRLKNSDDLINTFQILVNEASDVENANVGLAVLAARLNNFELSRKSVDKALVANPINQDAALIKLSYLFEGEDEQAVYSFADSYLKQNPDGHRLRMEYARYLSNHSEKAVAIKEFEKVAANDRVLYEEATLNIISLSMQDENYVLADKKLENLLDEDPTDNRLILYRCQVQRELANYNDASGLCQEISFGEYYFPAQLEIANVLADQDDIDAALIHLDNIPVSGTEEQVRVYMRQQSLLHAANELQRAVAVLDVAISKYNDNTSLLYARGLILSELGEVKNHERDMRRLIKLEPDNAHAYNALGYTLADLTSRYVEALELIQKAVELQPNDAYILDSLGWVYFKLNDLDKAKTHLEQAFDLSGDAEIAAHLGELYWTLGDKIKAKSIWNKARKETPDNKSLNRALERFL